jgi:uncharacterized protein YjiK
MRTLELITRTDIAGLFYWINFYKDGKKEDSVCFNASRKEEAYKVFEQAITNFEILGKETIISTASFNDEIRTVYVSADNGAAFLELKDFGSWYDIKTDASLDVVEHAMASNKGDIDKAIQEINEIGLFAERVKIK